MEFLINNIAPIMFAGLIVFLLMGFPVAFSLGACGLFFGFIGIELGILPESLLQALPLRIFGIMQNDTLLAIPFFTLMGLILERSGMAEDLLDTIGQLFGPLRGGLAIAVILVGALLAALRGRSSSTTPRPARPPRSTTSAASSRWPWRRRRPRSRARSAATRARCTGRCARPPACRPSSDPDALCPSPTRCTSAPCCVPTSAAPSRRPSTS